MYNRLLINDLRQWRQKKGRKPLVLRGARQVGKTSLVTEFGKEFDHFISLNLELRDDNALFAGDSTVNDVIDLLFLQRGISKGNCGAVLLFIDEIQENVAAVSMLRYFYEQTPWLHVIAAGSRLQTLVKKHVSMPVGRVEYMSLRPFNFAEFLEAKMGPSWVEKLASMEIPHIMHAELLKLFNKYSVIGGMPEAVAHYIENDDIAALAPIYKSLQTGYVEDIERYGKNERQIAVMRHILHHGWASAGNSITFAKFAGSDYTSSAVHEAMEVLQRGFLLSLDYPITMQQVPAIPSLTRSPKLIWVDTGLVNYFAGIQTEYLLNTDLLDTWRGRAAEHIVAQELRVVLDQMLQDEQYFWMRDKKGATAEVDFVIQISGRIIPIEVKTGTNSHLRSLHSYVDTFKQHVTAVRIWSGEMSVQDVETPAGNPYRLINIPLYLTGYINRIVEKFMI